ncbi:hypothetical protein FM125_01410 [Micrococcus lylae]|uniref:Uncharacterized protein n=1 Tax=Micrococcus lylae TaxID=1273 RepID=A0A1R4IC61_9MICC|nr:hypothetical protein FM125_01410 [Micrococcus lylae]
MHLSGVRSSGLTPADLGGRITARANPLRFHSVRWTTH